MYAEIVFVFFLLALILWSPVFALAYRLTSNHGAHRNMWLWAWMIPATVTVAVLGITGFVGDVIGSV